MEAGRRLNNEDYARFKASVVLGMFAALQYPECYDDVIRDTISGNTGEVTPTPTTANIVKDPAVPLAEKSRAILRPFEYISHCLFDAQPGVIPPDAAIRTTDFIVDTALEIEMHQEHPDRLRLGRFLILVLPPEPVFDSMISCTVKHAVTEQTRCRPLEEYISGVFRADPLFPRLSADVSFVGALQPDIA